MIDYIEQFRNAIQMAGIEPPIDINSDGKIHRFSSNGNRGDTAGWYVFHNDTIPAGCFGDWRTGINQSWRADIGRPLSRSEQIEYQCKIEKLQQQREEADILCKKQACLRAKKILSKTTPAETHAYLTLKNVEAHGIKLYKELLVIPIRDKDLNLCSLQFIAANKEKRFLKGGQ